MLSIDGRHMGRLFMIPGWRIGVTLAVTVGLMSSATAAGAPEPAKPVASLSVLVEQAWRLHPQAASLDARDAQASAAAEVAKGWTPEPGAVSLSNLNDRQNRNIGKEEWEVELSTPLWLPGQRAAKRQAADSDVNEAQARRQSVHLEIAGEVREAWWALVSARLAKSMAERKLDTARHLAADVQRRFRVGDLSRIDANLVQDEMLAAQSEAVEAEVALQSAEQVVQLLTGLPPPNELADEIVPTVSNDESWLASHPLLMTTKSAAQGARARMKVAEVSKRAAPELAVRMVRDRADFADPYANSVGVKLTLPFSSGAHVRRETSSAQAEADQSEAEARRIEARLPFEVLRARRALDSAQRQAAMAQERHVLATDNLALAEKSFALGESDLATLLRIRAAAYEADAFLDRQRTAHALAISRLNQALGVLP
jgi:cobalt-zinc-cadmium efflux system outer membrane protein